jgi:hypothetical protein
LSKDPYAIGFANFSYRTEAVKALGLVDERGVVSQPVFGDMMSGRYPLQRGIYIYVNRKPGAPLSPLMKEFLNFVLSKDGQSLVQVDHYLPHTAANTAWMLTGCLLPNSLRCPRIGMCMCRGPSRHVARPPSFGYRSIGNSILVHSLAQIMGQCQK